MPRRVVQTVALSVGLCLVLPTVADAREGDLVDAIAEVTNGQPTAIVISGMDGGVVASWTARATSGGSTWTCRYRPHIDADTPDDVPDPAIDPGADTALIEHQTYTLICLDQTGDLVYQNEITWLAGDPFSGLAAAERATDEALAALDVPTPTVAMSPPAGVDHLVGLDTWFWLTNWAAASATATLGATSSTVTITPQTITYAFGDGTPDLTCTGPGTPYTPGGVTDCGHRWITRSTTTNPNATTDITATITWQTTWAATTGQTGDLGTLTSSTTTAVRVLEAQAVVDY